MWTAAGTAPGRRLPSRSGAPESGGWGSGVPGAAAGTAGMAGASGTAGMAGTSGTSGMVGVGEVDVAGGGSGSNRVAVIGVLRSSSGVKTRMVPYSPS